MGLQIVIKIIRKLEKLLELLQFLHISAQSSKTFLIKEKEIN